MKFSATYLAAIVAINVGFEHVAPIALPNGDLWPPMSVAVGTIFVLRDYAQREIGHRVLLLMLLGAALSYLMASPALTAASLLAYLASELTDWALFTLTRWPFLRRVWVSSAISAPVDSTVFLSAIGVHSVSAVALMTVSKWAGIVALMFLHSRVAPCAFSHKYVHVGMTDDPWLHHYECERCRNKYSYSPWDEGGYR